MQAAVPLEPKRHGKMSRKYNIICYGISAMPGTLSFALGKVLPA
ncbi:hypothetical protein AcetOrient_orf03658 [Acetobacter orientalis]|uniref:Uncharacterized protein n=1 Tax=Acetobacter orientalis TaxID=146474 RepID=A0A2Z5ZJK2_9PROT|nr:hypothetical protein AcetOrient_orf03658 [Acetobacter orientalis]